MGCVVAEKLLPIGSAPRSSVTAGLRTAPTILVRAAALSMMPEKPRVSGTFLPHRPANRGWRFGNRGKSRAFSAAVSVCGAGTPVWGQTGGRFLT